MAGMKVNLTVIEGSEKGKVFSFYEPENFLLGRSAEGSKAHLCLSPDDTFVSRNHFLIEINPPDCFIRDAGSLNGTFIVRASEKTIFYLYGSSTALLNKFWISRTPILQQMSMPLGLPFITF